MTRPWVALPSTVQNRLKPFQTTNSSARKWVSLGSRNRPVMSTEATQVAAAIRPISLLIRPSPGRESTFSQGSVKTIASISR